MNSEERIAYLEKQLATAEKLVCEIVPHIDKSWADENEKEYAKAMANICKFLAKRGVDWCERHLDQ